MSDWADRAFEAIEALDDPTPSNVDRVTREFDARAVAAAAGSLGANAGGGSQTYITKTITAAELSAAFSVENGVAAIEVPEIDAGVPLAYIAEVSAPTIDGDFTGGSVNAYLPGASSDDIFNSGEGFGVTYLAYVTSVAVGTYSAANSGFPAGGIAALLPGAALYVIYVGVVPPTTGEIVLAFGIATGAVPVPA